MNAKTTKNWLAALSAALLTGCGYAPLPLQAGYGDSYNNYNTGVVSQNLPPTLPAGVTAKGLTLDPATANARVGESMPFHASVKGSDGKIYTDPRLVIWSLTNPQLGTIDQNGVLVPQQAGTVKIQATINGITATATVQVAEALFAWQQMISPTTHDLHAVEMVSQAEAWAGGDKGTMLRFINGAWHPEPTFTYASVDVHGLGFASTGLGWAVGQRGGSSTFVARWNGFNWTQESLPVTGGDLEAISVINDHDAWAVGQDDGGNALIVHYDGTNWKAMQSPGKGKLNAIQMLSGKLGWAVGKGGGLSTIPLIMKFQDGVWNKKGLWDNRGSISLISGSELRGIKMVSETQGYAVGVSNQLLTAPHGLFLTYDPKRDGWVQGKYDTKVAGLDQVPLYAIDMISGMEGWALGQTRSQDWSFQRNAQSIFGNLLANDGGVLKVDTNLFSGNLNGSFYAINLMPQGQGFVVGQNGYILQRTYDWRGTPGYGSSYGSSYGGYGNTTGMSPTAGMGMTYGPGGTQVPGTQPVSYY